ncbi:hypothetical protein [Ichthyenterobacterium magnum]|uniref:Uncharacterized protein n=1 Tax=Ichthyenterobacterium magnum TaxID=1230530 RepID=A0A420DUY7_9FLAO|nr:hypothetical protein [Ichthyenterobacterium magnum]RKE97989.1 hypothetical protein BXY80_0054 [Ichthyenterobacterium magnum]
MSPLFLYTADIMFLMNVCDKTALQTIKDINSHFELQPNYFVSITAFCKYFMMEPNNVQVVLSAKGK